jgi:hypothetical protein
MKSNSPGFTLSLLFFAARPHKALPSSALLEKHPVRRVGGAEGAPESTALEEKTPVALPHFQRHFQGAF